jgi:hypothetical protein
MSLRYKNENAMMITENPFHFITFNAFHLSRTNTHTHSYFMPWHSLFFSNTISSRSLSSVNGKNEMKNEIKIYYNYERLSLQSRWRKQSNCFIHSFTFLSSYLPSFHFHFYDNDGKKWKKKSLIISSDEIFLKFNFTLPSFRVSHLRGKF